MMKPQNWVEALNIDPEQLSTWSAQVPEGTPLLVWCLNESKISSESYFAWAMEHFELPFVSSDYFTTTFSPQAAQSLSGGDATPWLVPLEKWDNVTIVGCVEPQESEDPHTRFVLANAYDLANAYGLMTSSAQTVVEGTVHTMATRFEVPIGLAESTAVKPFKLDLNLDDPGLFSSPPEVPTKVDVAPLTPPELTATNIKGSQSTKLTRISQVSEVSQSLVSMPSIAPIHNVPTTTEPSEDTSGAFEVAAQRINQTYSASFVMRCSDGFARLYHWDSNLKPVKEGKDIAVELAFPTFLRIVARTGQPYHGYLVDSPAHREFFSQLGLDKLPGCVTAMPVKKGNALIGVIVAIGDESLQKVDSLRKFDEAAQPLARALTPAWSNAA